MLWRIVNTLFDTFLCNKELLFFDNQNGKFTATSLDNKYISPRRRGFLVIFGQTLLTNNSTQFYGDHNEYFDNDGFADDAMMLTMRLTMMVLMIMMQDMLLCYF